MGDKRLTYQQMQEELSRLKKEIDLLKKSEELSKIDNGKYRKMVDSIGDVIVIIDQQGINRYKSPNLKKIFGWNPEELVGEPALNNIHPDDLSFAQEFIASLMANPGIVKTAVCRYKCKDGSYKWIEFIGTNLIHDPDISGILGNYHDISGLKSIENALQQSETRFKSLFENMSNSSSLYEVIYDSNGMPVDYKFLVVNPAYEKIVGRNLASLLGKTLLEVYPGTEQVWLDTFKDVILTGVPARLENYSKETDKFFELVVFVPQKGQLAFIGSDITKRKQNELDIIKAKEKAEVNEEFYRKTFEQTAVGIAHVNPSGKFVKVNLKFCDIVGYSPEELIQLTISDITYPEDIEKEAALTSQILDNVVSNYCIEKRFVHKKGNLVWVILHSNVVRDKLGNIEFAVGTISDITEQKKLQEELIKAKEVAEESEQILREQKEEIELNNERLESLLRISQYQTDSIQELLDYALNEAIKLTNSKIGYIYYYNESTRQFTLNTWSKDVMKECAVAMPQTVYDLDKTGCWGEAVRQRKPIIINDYANDNPYKRGTPEGHVKLTKFLTVPVIIQHKVVAVAGVANKKMDYNSSDVRQLTLLMDNVWKISERITLIENLRIAKYKAEESDQLKTAFIQNMSHEIRTPMNAIVGFSELLASNFNNKAKLEHFSNIIKQRCNDLLVIIDDILDIAKIEAGQVSVVPERFEVNQLFEELVTLFTEHRKRIGKLHIQFGLKILNSSDGLIIETDKVRLKQVFINLINNAFKFTNEGSILGGCKIEQDGTPVFFVSDTGIGIPAEKQNLIFERFIQLDPTPTRMYGGTGLGLSIVKGLVELLGGKIWIESEKGRGTTFYFTLSCKSVNGYSVKQDQTSEIETYTFPESKTVLVVEDDIYNAAFINEILSDTGLNIISTQFGKEALDIVCNQPIDLVFMDIGLPDISGYEATRQIVQQCPGIKVIAQTAYASADDRQKALDSGCIDFISKPIKSKLFLSMLYKYLSGE